jgi:hypothetical protein
LLSRTGSNIAEVAETLGQSESQLLRRLSTARGSERSRLIREIRNAMRTVGTRSDQLARIGPVNAETITLFDQNPGLLRALADNPLAAAILKACRSPCYPPNATEAQIEAINNFLARAGGWTGRSGRFGEAQEAILREFFYARRRSLNEAIQTIERVGNLNQLEALLRNEAAERAARLRTASYHRAGVTVPALPPAPRGGEYTHSIAEHGARISAREMRERATGLRRRGAGGIRAPNGQWYDDSFLVEARGLANADNLVQRLPNGRTVHEFDMPYPVGRVFMPDGSVVSDVRRVRVLLLPNGELRNAFPITGRLNLP